MLLAALFFTTPSATGGIPISGYVCPSCPSVTDPAALFSALLTEPLAEPYSTINVAFAGFDANGNATNLFDTKTWSLTAATVQSLQKSATPPRLVMLSVGGGDGAVLSCASPMPSFASTLAHSLLDMIHTYGFDGIDWDIEHRTGDMVRCGEIISSVMTTMKSESKSLKFSIAPQVRFVHIK